MIFVKKTPDRKKETKKASSALRHARTDFRSIMSEERLNSFLTLIIKYHKETSPLNCRVNQSTGFYRDLGIYSSRYMFLDYETK